MNSNTIIKIFRQFADAVSSPSNVVMRGESGVGKEYLAKTVHRKRTKHGQFILYDCESTYEGQAKIVEVLEHNFSKPVGLETRTDTIFLRRLELLKENLQRDLLANLEANFGHEQIKQLGIICSIESQQGRIGSPELIDKYFEIDIKVPPLRERKDEIIPTSYNYIQFYNKENNRKISGITPETEKLLLNYNWPGNFDELYSELERAIAFTKDFESIKPSSFSQTFFQN